MSNEIQFHDSSQSGKTLYATLRNESGWFYDVAHEWWDVTPSAAEIGNYAVALAEVSTLGLFVGDLPTALDVGAAYWVSVHRRLGGAPAASDPIVGSGALGSVPADVWRWQGESVGGLVGGHVTCDVERWLGSPPAELTSGHVQVSVADIQAGKITAASIAADAIGASKLAGDVALEIAAAILTTPANKLATDASGRVTVGSNADKSGYSLVANGLDAITIDGQTLVAAFQIVLAALSGNVSSGGSGGAAGDYVVNLSAARNNLAARLAEVTASPKPSYSIGGQSVSWSEYQRLLLDQLAAIDERINGAEPFEDHSQAYS
jgi:hypothetical protein